MSTRQLDGAGDYLLAWDPVHMKAAWKQPKGSARAGVLATAGNLVFQGYVPGFGPPGNVRPHLAAYRADTGEELWTSDTQAGIYGGVVSYSVDGEQYVAAVSGPGLFSPSYWAPTYARLLVYKLDGKATLPPPAPFTMPALDPPAEFGTEGQLAVGEHQYGEHCASCHGNNGRVNSIFPDLKYAQALKSPELFKAIVIGGVLQDNGMVSFSKVLTEQDAEAIRAYVVHLSNEAKKAPPFPGFGPPPGGAGTPAPGPGGAPGAPPAPALHH
jgi:mono/diheme cytochrome c family protein